jgi:hypothetical protein
MQTAARTRRLGQLLSLLLVALATLGSANVSLAQGTEGLVPDPISSKDLRVYAERLSLTSEQRLALSELHVGYREKYRELRYGEIQDLFGRLEGFEPMKMPAVKEVKEVIDQRRRILSAIEDLDRGFFEEVQAVLTEEQLERIPRILRAREKQRYTLPFYGELGNIDLIELLDEMEMTAEELAAMDSVLEQYEIASTASARDFHDELIHVVTAMLKKLEELGINEDSFSNPLGMMATITAVDVALKETGKDLQAAVVKQRQDTERYMRQMGEVLPAGRAEALEQAYLRSVYSQVYPDRQTTKPMFEAALALEDLSEAQRTTLTDLRDRFGEQHRRVSQEMREAVDERMETIISVDPTGWESHWRTTQELRKERSDLNEQMRGTIKETLSEEQHDRAERQATRLASPGHRIYSESARSSRESTVTFETADGTVVTMDAEDLGDNATVVSVNGEIIELSESGEMAAEPEIDREQPVGMAHIGPFTTSDINGMARLLRLDRQQKEAALALHDDYLDRFQELREEQEETLLSEPQRRMYDEEGNVQISALDQMSRGRIEFRELVAEVDAEFLDEVEWVLMPDQAKRLEIARLHRQMSVFGDGNRRFYSSFSVPGLVNAIDLVSDLALSDEEFDAALPVLKAYATGSVPYKSTAYEVSQEQQQLWQRVMAESEANTPGDWMAISEIVREKGKPLREQSDQARKSLLELQEKALADLRQVLPDSQVAPLLRSFYETAYPNVYPDPTLVDNVFDEAMGLRDLTTPQYESLQAAFDHYAEEHSRACGQMIEAARGLQLAGENWFDPEAMRERGRHERMLETLRFDRQELNALYRMRIEAILTPGQVGKMRTLRREDD